MKKKDEKMGHRRMLSSVPLQLTPVSSTAPVPSPNAASPTAMASSDVERERGRREGEV